MTPTGEPAKASWSATLAATALVLAVQLRALLVPDLGAIHVEEAYDAAVALVLPWRPPGGALGLQYRPFCGGCTLEVWGAASLFRLLPPTVATWRLLALGVTALLAIATFRAVHRAVGPAGAWSAAALLAIAPVATSTLLLRSWGNHVEASALGLAAIAVLAGRPSTGGALAAGLLGALALTVGLTAGPFVVAALALVALERSGRRALALLAGLAMVALPWWVLATTQGEAPWDTLSGGGFAPPDDGPVARVVGLLAPSSLGRLLGTLDEGGVPAGLATAAALAVATGWALAAGPPALRAGAIALLAWLAAYLLGPFAFDRPAGRLLPIDVRYAAPLLLLVPWLVGGAVGGLRHRPVLAASLLAAGLAGGVPGRLAMISAPATTAHLAAPAADLGFFARMQALRAPERRAAWPCVGGAPTCLALRAHAAGVATVRRGRPLEVVAPEVAYWAGVAGELARGAPDGPPQDVVRKVGARLDALGIPPEVRPVALAEAAHDRLAGVDFARAVDDPTWRALAAAAGARAEPCDHAARPPSTLPPLASAWIAAHAAVVQGRVGGACAPSWIGWSDDDRRAWATAVGAEPAWLPAAPPRGSG
jgi:hypothetical protein